MKIAQIAPLYEAVPPSLYGGTERIVAHLTNALVELGHEVAIRECGGPYTSDIGSGTRSSHSARSVSAQIRTGRSPIHGATAQSVLAIQNARLFREIEDKSRQLELAR